MWKFSWHTTFNEIAKASTGELNATSGTQFTALAFVKSVCISTHRHHCPPPPPPFPLPLSLQNLSKDVAPRYLITILRKFKNCNQNVNFYWYHWPLLIKRAVFRVFQLCQQQQQQTITIGINSVNVHDLYRENKTYKLKSSVRDLTKMRQRRQ